MASLMKKVNCDFFRMSFEFDEKRFNKKAFLKDIGAASNQRQSSFHFSYGSKNKNRNEHAHMFMLLDGKDSFLQWTFSEGKNDVPDVREPYLEDAVQWLDKFFADDTQTPELFAVYEYNKNYESLIQLDYPLLIGSDLYEGAKVTGHDIEFPDEAMIHKATVNRTSKKGIRVFLFAAVELKLGEFDFSWTINMLGKYARALVKTNDDTSRTT